jgi:hypothetical protein
MVLIFSSNTNGSKQVQREVKKAFDGEKPVIPFRIEKVEPQKALAFYMGPVHWLDALTPPLEEHLKALAGTLRKLLGISDPVAPVQTQSDVRLRQEAPAHSSKPTPEELIAAVERSEAMLTTVPPSVRAALPIVLRRLVSISVDSDSLFTLKDAALAQFDSDDAHQLICILVKCRCAVVAERGGSATVRLVDRALIQNWPDARDFIETERELLKIRHEIEAYARQWEQSGRGMSYLLRHSRLLLGAKELLEGKGTELPASLINYVECSLAAAKSDPEGFLR